MPMTASFLPISRLCARRLVVARMLLGRLRRNRDGVSFLEFALILPVLLTLALYGTELAYMSVVDLQVTQMATSLADNASRLGQTDNSAVTPTVTEAMVDSVMKGARTAGRGIDFEQNGRLILSSLEFDTTTNRQYIHWQRCSGALRVASQYGAENAGKTGPVLEGMGKGQGLITASAGVAVMFVEATYRYQPLFGSLFVSEPTFHHEAAFLIRDDRALNRGVTGGNTMSVCT